MRLSNYKEDMIKQEAGSPCYVGEGFFLVRRFGTDESNKQVENIKRDLYGFAPKDIDGDLVLAHWLCDYGVTGWDGVLDEDDEPLKYTAMNARLVFMNPAFFKSINAMLTSHASNYASYLYDEVVEDVENIKKS